MAAPTAAALAAATLAEEPFDTNRFGFELTDSQRLDVYRRVKRFTPADVRRTPRQHAYWQQRNPMALAAVPDPSAVLPVLELKATRYLNERLPDETVAFLSPVHEDVVAAAMRMVVLHEERGFPMHELEAEYVFELYERVKEVRDAYRNDPGMDVFRFIHIANRWPAPLEDESRFMGTFALDARRFAVAACSMRIEVEFIHVKGREYTLERGTIHGVGPFHITTVRNGELVVLHRTVRPGVWVANRIGLQPDVEDNTVDVDADVDAESKEVYKFSWVDSNPGPRNYNAGVMRALDGWLNSPVISLRTEDTYELEDYEGNHMVSNMVVDEGLL